jgi:hypothetical protein
MARWLRSSLRGAAATHLAEETAAYYDGLTSEGSAEDKAIGEASGRAARSLAIDEPRPRRRRR